MFPFLKKLILLRWVFIVACRLFLVAVSRGYSPAVVCGLLIVVASLVAEDGSRHTGFNSCGTQAQQLSTEGPRVLRHQCLWRLGSAVAACGL